MANDERIMLGMRPFCQPGERIRINYYQINTGQNLFRFQPVVRNNSGQVGAQNVIVDNSGIIGVIMGFVDTDQASLPTNLTDLTQNAFLDSSSNALAAVADDPNQLFILEEDTGGTLIGSENSAGQTVHYTFLATTGNTTTGVSNAVLDRSTISTGTGGNLTLIRAYREYVNRDGTLNAVSGNFAKWIVKITTHQNGPVVNYIPTNRPS